MTGLACKPLRMVASNLEHRLEGLNELRADVIKDRDLFLKKDVFDQVNTALQNRVSKLESWQAKIVGGGILLMALSAIFGAVISKLIGIK